LEILKEKAQGEEEERGEELADKLTDSYITCKLKVYL
jgi:hypothetical protein